MNTITKFMLFFYLLFTISTSSAQVLFETDLPIPAPPCTSKIIIVDNLTALNAGLNELVNGSNLYSTTVIIKNGSYGNIAIDQNDPTEIGLWRDISPKGCPCEIKAHTPNNVNLYGKLMWRISNAKNLTISGINFIKTTKHYASGLIDIIGNSENIEINNCEFKEIEMYFPTTTNPSGGTGDNNVNYYINLHVSTKNKVKNSRFYAKFSHGHYINNRSSRNNLISECMFSEIDRKPSTWSRRNFIYSVKSNNTIIEFCEFKDKKTRGHYIELTETTNDLLYKCDFKEDFLQDDPVIFPDDFGATYFINIIKGDKNKIDDNDFINKFVVGNYIDISQFDIDESKNQHSIINNRFNKMVFKKAASMIKLGNCGSSSTTADIKANILVSGNMFYDYDVSYLTSAGEFTRYTEIISNKSSGNIFQNNTFEDCCGSLNIRCGNNCKINGNRFIKKTAVHDEIRGITISGSGHKIFNNYFEGVDYYTIVLNAGNTLLSNQDLYYGRVENVEIAFNTMVNCTNNIRINKYEGTNDLIAINSKIENNIFDFTNSENIIISVDDDFGNDPDVITDWNSNKFQNNFYYSNSTQPIIRAGFEEPIIVTDPLFLLDPLLEDSSGEYIPSNFSGIIDNAILIDYNYVDSDINGTPRTGLKDIGCHEIVSSSLRDIKHNTKEFKVFPNPTTNFINLLFDDSLTNKKIDFEIQDLSGKVLFVGEIVNSEFMKLDVSKFSKGMHILNVRSSNYLKSYKFLKL